MTSLYKVYGVNSVLMHDLIVLSIEVETITYDNLTADDAKTLHRSLYIIRATFDNRD